MTMAKIAGTAAGAAISQMTAIALAAALATVSQSAVAQDRDDQAVAYAQCVRDNGYAEFPDPGPDGRTELRIGPEDAPRFEAAQEACQELAPEGLTSFGAADPERVEQLVRVAQCMRDNGFPEFPDPTPEGQFNITGLDFDPETPAAQQAMQGCTEDNAGPDSEGAGISFIVTR